MTPAAKDSPELLVLRDILKELQAIRKVLQLPEQRLALLRGADEVVR